MVHHNKDYIRINGVYYTPDKVAEAFIRLSGFDLEVSKKRITAFDPAFGNGSLLRTACDLFKESEIVVTHAGCDINPDFSYYPYTIATRHLEKRNFFTLPTQRKFDLILANPPYVRHTLIEDETKQILKEQFPEGKVHGRSDLWVYFLLKSLKHLKKGANVGMILPWSILQADYAVNVRKVLFTQFGQIRLLALNSSYFDDAEERVVFLYLNGYGKQCKSIEVSYAESYTNEIRYTNFSKEEWLSNKVTVVNAQDYLSLYSQLQKKYGFTKIGDIANIKIGVVTGANSFFIRKLGDWEKYALQESTKPIITKSAELVQVDDGAQLKRVLITDRSSRGKLTKVLTEGVAKNIHLRSHPKRRETWHSLEEGLLPDAFFPYRVKEIPFIVSNDLGVTCTNSVHRVYFRSALSSREKRWLLIASLSVYTQLSFLLNAKTYGRGMVKMEPTAIKNSILPPLIKAPIAKDYHKIIKLIRAGNKSKAVLLATEVVSRELGIPQKVENQAFAMYYDYTQSNKR